MDKKYLSQVYKWFGHNRTTVHKRAKTGSGSVGFLIRESLSEVFDIRLISLMKVFCG